MNKLQTSRLGALLLGLALCLGLAGPVRAAQWGLAQLMDSLSHTIYGHASFVETKTLSILDQPVESSGELFYSAPDHIEKRTLQPKFESLSLDRGTLTIEQAGTKAQEHKHHVLQLQRYPEIAVFIESIRATLAGDRRALQRSYQVRLTGTEQQWTLELLPSDSRMQKIVERIRISGERDALKTITVSQANGDRSVMTITPIPAP